MATVVLDADDTSKVLYALATAALYLRGEVDARCTSPVTAEILESLRSKIKEQVTYPLLVVDL